MTALRRRTTAVLGAGQVLGGLAVATSVALATVLAEDVTGSEGLAGLASTASVVGTAVLSLPFAALMTARGRRPGLTLAYLIAALGGTVVVLGAVLRNFPLMLLGMAAFGAGSSANLQARFAAADLAAPERRARAISTVVWATTLGAVLGPSIAGPAGRSVAGLGLGIPVTAGPFVWGSAVFLCAALLVHLLLRPDPLLTARELAARDPEGRETGLPANPGAGKAGPGTSGPGDAGPGRPGPGEHASTRPRGTGRRKGAGGRALQEGMAAVAASARARVALVTIAGAHTVMVSIMVMTPVDLTRHGADIDLIGFVFSVHIAGMYAFSPLMGWLADRLGRLSVIALAVALLGCAAALAGTAQGEHARSLTGLFLLGLGWSAALVAGSALLTDSVPQHARAAVQGLSDLTMNGAAAAGGALSGLVVSQAGYGWLTAGSATLLLPVAALVLVSALRRTPAAGPRPPTGGTP
ncbi:MFS transporter [Streptomyces sp. JJ36]|uniref:MFS transporter n=1 Tax=Streptomyces sp. JJ36 TaxID=2736645 RepID=UPI001F003339|nr:MFS transporter [Streptomyces sp. JJ36]